MPNEKWDSLKRAIENNIDPLLKPIGYLAKGVQNTDKGGLLITYDPNEQSGNPIIVHAVKQLNLKYVDKARCETWLRVYIGSTFLKTSIGGASETNPDLRAGWLYADDAEMSVCIQEILDGLKRVLNQP